MSGSDSEYLPGDDGDEDSELEYQHVPPAAQGWSTSGTDDDDSDFFEDEMDAGAFLQTLEQQQQADTTEPLDFIRQHRQERRRQRAEHDGEDREQGIDPTFGASVEDIWDDPVADQLAGLGRRRKKKGSGRGPKSSKAKAYSEEVARKIGQANLLLMTRPHEALDVLNQIIRMAPNTLEAWRLMGQVHEALGNPRKALDCCMLAAQCGATSHEDWKRLAELSTQFCYFRQAVHCLGKAIKAKRNDIDARWARAEILAGLNEINRALAEYSEIGRLRPGDPEVVTRLAKLHFHARQPNKAIQLLEAHMKDNPGSADLTHVNILAELYMEQGALADAVKLIERSGRVMCPGQPLPLDLTVKMGICQLRLGNFEAGAQLLATLEEEGDPAAYSDLYMEVAATQTSLGRHDDAARYYQRLLDVPEVVQPLLWRNLVFSLRAGGRLPEAITLYESKMDTLMPADPLFLEAALTLAEMWLEGGELEKVQYFLATLDNMLANKQVALPGASAEQLALFVRKNQLHMALGQGDAAVVGLLPLVTAQLQAAETKLVTHPGLDKAVQRAIKKKQRERAKGKVRSDTEQEGILFAGYSKGRDRRKRHVREADKAAEEILSGTDLDTEGEPSTSAQAAVGGLLHDDTMFPVFVQLCEVMVQSGQLDQVETLLARASKLMNGKSRDEKRRRDVLRMLLADTLGSKRDYQAAVAALKALCMRWPHSWGAWNRFSQLYCTMSGGTISWMRFVSAMRTRHPTSVVLMLLQGHTYAMNQSWRAALSEYFQAYHFLQDEPLVLLCIGVAYIHLAMTKRVTDRNRAILHGFMFLEEYRRLRANDQEALYNMGRAAHQLGLGTVAMTFYERALQVAPVAATSSSGAARFLDLSKEIAHNLVLIYSASGATELARRVMVKHLVIR